MCLFKEGMFFLDRFSLLIHCLLFFSPSGAWEIACGFRESRRSRGRAGIIYKWGEHHTIVIYVCTPFTLCMWHAGPACLDLFIMLRYCLYGIRLKGESGVWTMERRWVTTVWILYWIFSLFFFSCSSVFHAAAPERPLLHLGWRWDRQTERGRDRATESRAFTVKRKTGAHVQTGECCTAAYRGSILRHRSRHTPDKTNWFKPSSSQIYPNSTPTSHVYFTENAIA